MALTKKKAEPLAGGAPVDPELPSLQKRRVILAQGVWWVYAALAVVLFVVAVPSSLHYLSSVCTRHSCSGPQLTPSEAQDLAGIGISLRLYGIAILTNEMLFAAISVGLATGIVWRKPGERIALFGGVTLLSFGVAFPNTLSALATLHPAARPLVQGIDVLGLSCLLVFFYVFPDGRFIPGWTRWLVPLILAGPVLQAVPGKVLPSPLLFVWFALALGGPVAAQIYRYRRVSSPSQRQQTKWVVAGLSAAIAGFLGVIFVPLVVRSSAHFPAVSNMLGIIATYWFMLLIPGSIAVAILRYRLWDIDIILNRTLVYLTLSASVIGLYVLVVAGLGALLQLQGNIALSLLATALVALLFHPLHERLQRAVNRLLYGERDEPYAVISRLGQQLETSLAPDAVVPAIVETVAQALKLPYVAIALKRESTFRVEAGAGTPTGDPLVLPLVYQGEPVGRLLLEPRLGDSDFSPADRRLLDDLARQAGVAAYAVRLTTELQRSRERLVTAREEERRRLRRDLHDGLGPALASQALALDGARKLMATDPAAADALLADLTEHTKAAVDDIRRLVYALRPPALDELGLVAALGEQVEGYRRAGIQIEIDAPEALPALPAAVEVAAYRIAQEALTNVIRHAGAAHACVRLRLEGNMLTVEVRDDGRGIPEGTRAGIGLTSMRERATELGGACMVEPAAGGGTRLLVRLPLMVEE